MAVLWAETGNRANETNQVKTLCTFYERIRALGSRLIDAPRCLSSVSDVKEIRSNPSQTFTTFVAVPRLFKFASQKSNKTAKQ